MQAFDFEELSIHLDVSDQGFCEATAGKPQESTSATSLINFFPSVFLSSFTQAFASFHAVCLHHGLASATGIQHT